MAVLLFDLKRNEEALQQLALALMQDPEQVEFIFELNPKLRKNQKINKLVAEFKSYSL
jgi:hypothetical protein